MFCTQKRPPFAGNDVLNDAHQSLLSLSGMFYHQMCTLGCQKNDINIELLASQTINNLHILDPLTW